MAYKLISGRPLGREVKRLFDQEIIAVTSGLTPAPGFEPTRRVHDTRKHVKKARALLRAARHPLGRRYLELDEELRTANRALGRLTDARHVLETLDAVQREAIVQLPGPAFSAMRLQFEARASAIESAATLDEVRARSVRLVKSVRQEVANTDLRGLDRAAIVAEIRDAHAAARKARKRAVKQPSVAHFHGWRRIVKREWQLIRLVSELTGDRLRDERHQLAALDACLGELHDLDVLASAIAAHGPLSRPDMSHVLRALRAHAHDLRHLARRLSSVLDEKPQTLARRVRVLWGSLPRRREAGTVRALRRSA